MRRCTRSPGIAPRRARPGRRRARSSARRPPASRSSSGDVSPGVSIDVRPFQSDARQSGERDRRQAEALAHEPIDRGVARARERVGGHRALETRQLARRLRASSRRCAARPAPRSACLQQLASSAASRSISAVRALAAQPAGRRCARVELARRRDRSGHRTPAPSAPLARADVSRSTTRSRCAGSDCGRGVDAASDDCDSPTVDWRGQPRSPAATRRRRRGRRLRRSRSAPAAGAGPSGSSARNTDRCRQTRP